MSGLTAIIALVVVLLLVLGITRLATAALVLTGLSEEAAHFQALSAFTGTGFTTGEAEGVVRHPVRRRIVMGLMILHSVGLVAIIVPLVQTFRDTPRGAPGHMSWLARMGWLAVAVGLVFLVARSRIVDRQLSRVMNWMLKRWTDLDTRDYVSLLDLAGQYTVREMAVEPGDWLAGKCLKDCRLPDAGITVLGITRGAGAYVGVPTGQTQVNAGDVLVLYGHADALAELDKRRACPPSASQAPDAPDGEATRGTEEV